MRTLKFEKLYKGRAPIRENTFRDALQKYGTIKLLNEETGQTMTMDRDKANRLFVYFSKKEFICKFNPTLKYKIAYFGWEPDRS